MTGVPERGDVLILGLGVSGEAAAAYFAKRSCPGGELRTTVLDEADGPRQRERAAELRRMGVDVCLGVTEASGRYDLIVASPGIAPHNPLMTSARASGAPVISELELAWRESESPWVAVTGTNGKTTVTSLIGHILGECGIPAVTVGNIGDPAITAAAEVGRGTVLVAECSSFQLALTSSFSPRVSVLLNITPDHLDWHGSMEAYAADKARVFANQGPDDTAVVDVDDAGSAPFAERLEALGVRVAPVSLRSVPAGGAGLVGGALALDGPDGPLVLVEPAEMRIRGRHNVSNALAAVAAAHALGAPLEGLRAGLRSFAPVEHRLEPVEWVRGVEYYNDSKATNPDAVMKALGAFDDRPVVILLGGQRKDVDLRPLAAQVSAVARAAVLFGEARGQLADAFDGLPVPTLSAGTMAEGVRAASGLAREGDVVLLSPGCKSFDEFGSYEERGCAFKDEVAAIALRASEA